MFTPRGSEGDALMRRIVVLFSAILIVMLQYNARNRRPSVLAPLPGSFREIAATRFRKVLKIQAGQTMKLHLLKVIASLGDHAL